MIEAMRTDNERLVDAASSIVELAFSKVAARYGAGETGGLPQPAENPLAYHNLDHTADVVAGTMRMADALGLTAVEKAVARVSAAAHDIVQLKPRGIMEQESYNWLAPRMFRAQFAAEHIRAARLAIEGTEPTLTRDGFMIGQKVTKQDYPDNRSRLIAQAVACGDMSELYSPHGPLKAHRLYQELQGVDMYDTPPMNGLMDFQSKQMLLVRNYRYPHQAGEDLFAGLRDDVWEHQAALTGAIQRGFVTNWEQVIERDIKFAYAHL